MLRRRYVHGDAVILWREQATLAAVLKHLPTATVFHAATHGRHDPRQPQQSSLHLGDTPLRLEMLRETRLESARLVFLSACESGLAGVRILPEEFIGLPAGFVQAGAACVIGTLWPIGDAAALLLDGKFYELLLDEQGRERRSPAEALSGAQDWLRQLTFGALKQVFPVQTDAKGSWVLLSGAMRFDSDDAGIPLALGNDDDHPFAAATHWAAFAATGA
jgi:CHAT domain-containing protein